MPRKPKKRIRIQKELQERIVNILALYNPKVFDMETAKNRKANKPELINAAQRMLGRIAGVIDFGREKHIED